MSQNKKAKITSYIYTWIKTTNRWTLSRWKKKMRYYQRIWYCKLTPW